MATIEHDGGNPVKWETITENDEGQPIRKPARADVCVHVKSGGGAGFGGGNIPIEGSNDGVTWVTLKDLSGTALEFTAEDINTVRDNVEYIRPGSPTGTSVDLDVLMTLR